MKINVEIDTKRDSKEEILRIIHMLHQLLNDAPLSSTLPSFASSSSSSSIPSSYDSGTMPGLGFLGDPSSVVSSASSLTSSTSVYVPPENSEDSVDVDSFETY